MRTLQDEHDRVSQISPHAVYTIHTGRDVAFWTRLGEGFNTCTGDVPVVKLELRAWPVNGKITVRGANGNAVRKAWEPGTKLDVQVGRGDSIGEGVVDRFGHLELTLGNVGTPDEYLSTLYVRIKGAL